MTSDGRRDRAVEYVARAYWDMPAEKRSWDKLGEQLTGSELLGGWSFETLRKLAVKLDHEGRVEHCLIEPADASFPRRSVSQERQLVSTFRLRHAMVSHIPGILPEEARLDSAVAEERIMLQLATLCSSLLLALLRHGDRVGVACGRAMRHVIDCIDQRSDESRPRVDTIMSLAGYISTHRFPDDLPIEPRQDADQIATQLYRLLDARAIVCVNQELLAGKARVDRLIPNKGDYLCDDWSSSKSEWRPHVALVGIGAVMGRHRLCYADRLPDLNGGCNNQAENVSEKIMEMVRIAAAVEKQVNDGDLSYHCLGDLSGYLYLVPPPNRSRISEVEIALLDHVKWYNEHVCAVTIDQLSHVTYHGAVILVGGGYHKRHALRFAMDHSSFSEHLKKQNIPISPWFNHLVTDWDTSRWLCENAWSGR